MGRLMPCVPLQPLASRRRRKSASTAFDAIPPPPRLDTRTHARSTRVNPSYPTPVPWDRPMAIDYSIDYTIGFVGCQTILSSTVPNPLKACVFALQRMRSPAGLHFRLPSRRCTPSTRSGKPEPMTRIMSCVARHVSCRVSHDTWHIVRPPSRPNPVWSAPEPPWRTTLRARAHVRLPSRCGVDPSGGRYE